MAWAAVAGAAVAVVGGAVSANQQAGAAKDAANASANASGLSQEAQKKMYDQARYDQKPWQDAGKTALQKLLLGVGSPNQTSVRDLPGFNKNGWDSEWDNLVYNGAKFGNPLEVAELTANTEAAYRKKYGSPSDPVDSDPNNGALLKNFTMADYQKDPGYDFRLSEGQKALDRSAAAAGGLQSGAALKAASRFGQDYASNEYGKAYDRFNTDKTNQFNRLASLAGVGQMANNALSSAGQNYANQYSNLAMINASNQGNAALSAGNARASSYSGLGNALGNINWGT